MFKEGDIVQYTFGMKTFEGIYLRQEYIGKHQALCAIIDVPEKGVVNVHLDKIKKVA